MGFIVAVLLIGALGALAAPREEIPTYYMHDMCGQSINFRRESVFMVKIELHTFALTNKTQLIPADSYPDSKSSAPCVLNIESWSFQNRLMIHFEELGGENQCSNPQLQLFDGPDENSPDLFDFKDMLCSQGDDNILSRSLTTTDKHLTFRFHGDNAHRSNGIMRAVLVSFHSGTCLSYEHQCFNGRCIMEDLRCNGHNPCGDFSDCPVTLSLLPQEVANTREGDVTFVVIVSSISVAILIAGAIVVFLYCRSKRKPSFHHHQHNYASVVSDIREDAHHTNFLRPQPTLERTVSQIETERRFAPPSYSKLPVIENEAEQESKELEPGPLENEEIPNEIMISKCQEPDENNPPSYACVMLHQDKFKLSEPNIYALARLEDTPSPKRLTSLRHERTHSVGDMIFRS